MENKYFWLSTEEREKWNTLETIGQQATFLADLKRIGKAEHPFFCVGNIRFPIDIDEHTPENEVWLKTKNMETLEPLLYILKFRGKNGKN